MSTDLEPAMLDAFLIHLPHRFYTDEKTFDAGVKHLRFAPQAVFLEAAARKLVNTLDAFK